jgi:hypothetical protein
MAEKGRLLCVEELDLIEFLVASLSSSLACKVAIVKSPVAHEVVILQFEPVIPSANPSPPDIRGCADCRRQVINPSYGSLGATGH